MKSLASGAASGITTELQGGRFGHGFVSAGLGFWSGLKFGGPPTFGQFLASAIAGGTISELTGGKFANGAISAGLAYVVAAAHIGASRYLSNDDNPPIPANLSAEQTAELDAKIAALNADLKKREYTFGTEADARDYLHSRAGQIGRDYGVELASAISKTTGNSYLVSPVRTDYFINRVDTPGNLGSIYVADWHNHPGSGSGTFSGTDIDYTRHASYLTKPDGSLWYFNYGAAMNSAFSDKPIYIPSHVRGASEMRRYFVNCVTFTVAIMIASSASMAEVRQLHRYIFYYDVSEYSPEVAARMKEIWDDAIEVSMIRLIANPEAFDRKSVRLTGVFTSGERGMAISFDRESYEYSQFANAVAIAFAGMHIDPAFTPKLEGQYVEVIGVYSESTSADRFYVNGELQEVLPILPSSVKLKHRDAATVYDGLPGSE